MPWCGDGVFLRNFCVLYFEGAACSTFYFQTCILNSHEGHVICWSMVDIQSPMAGSRRGKKKERNRKKEGKKERRKRRKKKQKKKKKKKERKKPQLQNIMACQLLWAVITRKVLTQGCNDHFSAGITCLHFALRVCFSSTLRERVFPVSLFSVSAKKVHFLRVTLKFDLWAWSTEVI